MKVRRVWLKPFRSGAFCSPGTWFWEVYGPEFMTSGDTRADAVKAYRQIKQIRRKWR
jgi:hypothetical protein